MQEQLINTNICAMEKGGSQIASKYEEVVYLVGIINRHATLFSAVKHGGRKTGLGRRSIPLECLVLIRLPHFPENLLAAARHIIRSLNVDKPVD